MKERFDPGDRIITSYQKYRGLTGEILDRSIRWSVVYYKVIFRKEENDGFIFDDDVIVNLPESVIYRTGGRP